jgi:hypothetical protein
MSEGEDSIELKESVTANLEIVRSISSPKVIVSIKIVADLDKLDKVPEMCVKAVKDIYDKASKIGLSLQA